MIAQCAAAFINLPAEFIDNELEISFQDVLRFFDLDRINLMEFSGGTGKMHLLSTRGTKSSLPSTDSQQLPWTYEQLMQGKPILVSSLDDLPAQANDSLDYLKAHGIRLNRGVSSHPR